MQPSAFLPAMLCAPAGDGVLVSWPVGAGTVTMDSLEQGVPVVTLPGVANACTLGGGIVYNYISGKILASRLRLAMYTTVEDMSWVCA